MDDDDEILPHASPESGSYSPLSGRITVTVAAAPPTTVPPPQSSLTLALPIQQTSGGGREDCWSEGATAVLIDAWGERYKELSRGNLKQKHWKEVADIVSSRDDYRKPPKTDVQCKNRIDTVKKKYKLEKAKVTAGGGPSRWPFFDLLDRLIGPGPGPAAEARPPAPKAVPVGIPVGVRPMSVSLPFPAAQQLQTPPPLQQIRVPQMRYNNSNVANNTEFVRPPLVECDSDSGDSLPPERRKRRRREKGDSVRELTRAILKFGEAYEAAESAKLQHVVEMEKQRMKFAKELELQRMKFLMKTQLELSKLNGVDGSNNNGDDGRGGGSSGRAGSGGVGGVQSNHHHHHHLHLHENHLDHGNSDSSN